MVNFVMLNPSTADAVKNDPTIHRCIGYARAWGYSRLVVTNLSPFRTTRPTAMVQALPTIPPEVDERNRTAIRTAARESDLVVCAWGVNAQHLEEHVAAVRAILAAAESETGTRVVCLGRTKEYHPRHPLYCAADAVLQPFLVRT